MEKINNNIDSLFQNALEHINNTNNINDKTKTYVTDDKIKLKFYKYYKQATIGDCNIPQPSLFDFTNKVKWEAWNSLKGMSQEKAKCLYIKLLQSLDTSFNN